MHNSAVGKGVVAQQLQIVGRGGWVEGGKAGDRILTGSAAGGSPGKLCGPTPASTRRFFNSDKRMGCGGQAPHDLLGTLEPSSWLTHWASIGMRV